MKDLLNTGQVLGRSEMKKIMAGSGSGDCQHTPCAWPQYAACCCSDGSKTCFENSSGGILSCWAFCGIGG